MKDWPLYEYRCGGCGHPWHTTGKPGTATRNAVCMTCGERCVFRPTGNVEYRTVPGNSGLPDTFQTIFEPEIAQLGILPQVPEAA